jgi:growth arrest and DNA-damage-inducible protein
MVITSDSVSQTMMGSLVKKALVQAKIEKRVVLGLPQVVRCLSMENSNFPLFCLIAPPKSGDYGTHMQEVLLQAYCFENDIHIIHLDSASKLSRIMESSIEESCALIYANPSGDSDCEGSFLDEDFQMTKIERKIINFCEDHWDDSEHSTIRLPEK